MGVHPHTYIGHGFSVDFNSYSKSKKHDFLEFFAPEVYLHIRNSSLSANEEDDHLEDVFGGTEPYVSTTSNGFRIQIIELENMLFVTTYISHHSNSTGQLKTDLLDLKKIKRAERNMTELFEEGAKNYLQIRMRGKEYPKPGFFVVTFMR